MRDPDRSKIAKREAEYSTSPDDDGAPPNARCGNCAHFVPPEDTANGGGLCKVVEGEIRADAVCFGFYADFGVFADNKLGRSPEISMLLDRGGTQTWTRQEALAFIDALAQELEMLRQQ